MAQAQGGEIELQEFLQCFLKTELIVPSGTKVRPDGSGLAPLLFDKSGMQMMGVFTSSKRSSIFDDRAPFCVKISGRELFSRVPSGIGIVVNPGYDIGFEISSSGLKRVLQDM